MAAVYSSLSQAFTVDKPQISRACKTKSQDTQRKNFKTVALEVECVRGCIAALVCGRANCPTYSSVGLRPSTTDRLLTYEDICVRGL